MAFDSVRVPVQSLTQVLARPEDLFPVEDFRVASYNVWNLFGEDPDVYSRRPSPPASEAQLDALAKMILSIDADVIAFQEVQNEPVLAGLFRERVNPKIEDDRYRFSSYVCIPARDPRGINVALATRFAVRACVSFHDREFGPADQSAVRFARDLLGVELMATPKYRFLMFVAHLKSKIGGEKAAGKRRIEAGEIRTILEEPQFGGNPYIDQDLVLCGDMNDDPDSNVVQILTAGTHGGVQPLRDALGPFKSYPTHKKYKETRLDYILASPSLEFREPQVHTAGPAVAASDHYPVSVTVRVK